MSTTPTTDREAARRAQVERVLAIHNAAVVREHLGQAAIHRRLPDGRHEITLRGQTWTGDTLDAAISAAKGWRRAP